MSYIKALDRIEELLVNLQPHIEQACYPGHDVFIDNYINPALDTARSALDKRRNSCPECEGVGELDTERGGSWVPCNACDGTGRRADAPPLPEPEDAVPFLVLRQRILSLAYENGLLRSAPEGRAGAILSCLRELARNAEEGEVLTAEETLDCAEAAAAEYVSAPAPQMGVRSCDMAPGSLLQLTREDDGDICVTIHDGDVSAYVEFCTTQGGGKSPRTWRALYELMRAMDADAKERP